MKFKIIFIIAVLIVLNGFLNLNILSLVVTIPEILVVVCFLVNKKTTEALFWHTIFFITSFSNIFTEDFLLLNNISSSVSYNYANLGFHGIRLSLIVTFLIILVQRTRNEISNLAKTSVFYRLYRFFLFCVVTGFVLGGLGLLVLEYSFSNFLYYGYYSLFCVGFALSYLYEYETPLKDDIYQYTPYIIAISVIFDFVCSLLGLKESLIVIGTTGLGAYCFILIPLLLFQKKSIPILAILGMQLYMLSVHTSGKQLYSLIFLFIATIILSFSKSVKGGIGKMNRAKMWVVAALVVAGYPMLQATLSSTAESNEGNLEWKMNSVESLTDFFVGEGDMDDVSASPYIRLAEVSNIVYEDIRNPVYLLFGRGFGGYYRDELCLFNGFDLANGAFSKEEIQTGKFSSGHDTFVTVPMLNGFIGFFMLLSLIIATCKKSPQNYLYLTSLLFLLLWFYYDVLMGVIGVMLLFAAEHKVQKT